MLNGDDDNGMMSNNAELWWDNEELPQISFVP